MASTEKLQRENRCWPKKNKKADLIPKNILMVSKRFVCGQTRQKLNFFEGFHGGFATSGPGWPAMKPRIMLSTRKCSSRLYGHQFVPWGWSTC